MDDQVISFETAKLLREIIDFPYNIPNWYSEFGKLNHSHTAGNEFHIYKGIPAPSQSLLQRWLRENHDIHIVIEPWTDEGDRVTYEWTVYSDLIEEEDEDENTFDSYEEALESALQEGLNLIKSKNK